MTCCGSPRAGVCERHIVMSDDHVPGRIPLVNALPIRRNPLGQRTQFFLLVPLSTFGSYPAGWYELLHCAAGDVVGIYNLCS
jgi:hypothetical protein